ncbi:MULTISPECIES: hypothetical protein [unclassified Nocardia]|uniref:hypothetical protein n=1 Tax=unclassified Nocardia TaxID=2637762 RepID=UPI00343E11DF
MQPAMPHGNVYYRCIARTLAPGSEALADHPKTVNLRESHVAGPLNRWLAAQFSKENRRQIIEILVEAYNSDDSDTRRSYLRLT